ncbi:hypothetical protein F4703DRAFT_1195944 [Phycomyces blakesleeanus]
MLLYCTVLYCTVLYCTVGFKLYKYIRAISLRSACFSGNTFTEAKTFLELGWLVTIFPGFLFVSNVVVSLSLA